MPEKDNSNEKTLEFNFVESLRSLGKPVTYYPNMAHALGNDPGCALFLSNFYYWEGKQEDKEGWIYKSQADIYRETGLTRAMQERARKKLRQLAVLEEEVRRVPATVHYRWNWQKVNEVLNKHFRGLKIDIEKPEDPLIFSLRELFMARYMKQVQVSYEWPTDKKLSGKHWQGITLLKKTIARRIIEKKMSESGLPSDQIEVHDGEIKTNFNMFLESLPEYHLERNLSPMGLYSNFSKIISDIKHGKNKSTDASATSNPYDYV